MGVLKRLVCSFLVSCMLNYTIVSGIVCSSGEREVQLLIQGRKTSGSSPPQTPWTNGLYICDLKVYDTQSNIVTINVADVSQSSTVVGGDASNAIDNNDLTCSQTSWSTNNNREEFTASFCLKDSESVGKIIVKGISDKAQNGYQQRGNKLYIDGVWVGALGNNDYEEVMVSPTGPCGLGEEIKQVEIKGGSSYLHICELKVYSGNEELFLFDGTSKTAGWGTFPGIVIDGVEIVTMGTSPYGYPYHPSCFHSNGGSDFLKFNVCVPQSKHVTSIKVWNRDDGGVEARLNGYKFYYDNSLVELSGETADVSGKEYIVPTPPPTPEPSEAPSSSPSSSPSEAPSSSPSSSPSISPSSSPSISPSSSPSLSPSSSPSLSPSSSPSTSPTVTPSGSPTTVMPTISPTLTQEPGGLVGDSNQDMMTAVAGAAGFLALLGIGAVMFMYRRRRRRRMRFEADILDGKDVKHVEPKNGTMILANIDPSVFKDHKPDQDGLPGPPPGESSFFNDHLDVPPPGLGAERQEQPSHVQTIRLTDVINGQLSSIQNDDWGMYGESKKNKDADFEFML